MPEPADIHQHDQVELDRMADHIRDLPWWGNGCTLTIVVGDETLTFELLEENRAAAVEATRAAVERARRV